MDIMTAVVMAYSNISILHQSRDIITFAVYMAASDLVKSLIFHNKLEIKCLIHM